MHKTESRHIAAGLCILAFVCAQTFQELAYWLWIPAPHGLKDELQTYLLAVDQARALLVGGTILLLIVPYAVIALRYMKNAPMASLLGLIFGAAFIGFEI